jgi:multiple sugar transport system permease protein
MVELVHEAMLVPSKSWTWFFPRVRPGCIKVGLFAFLAAWNEFVAHLVFINDDTFGRRRSPSSRSDTR